MSAPKKRPPVRQVEPDGYLGADEGGREYYLLKSQVYSHQEGHTAWVGSLAAVNRTEKMHRATAA